MALYQHDRVVIEASSLPEAVKTELINLMIWGDVFPIDQPMQPLNKFEKLERNAIFGIIDQIKSLELSDISKGVFEGAYERVFDDLINNDEFGFTLLQDPQEFFENTMRKCAVDMYDSINLEELGKRVSAVIQFHDRYFKVLFASLKHKYLPNIGQ